MTFSGERVERRAPAGASPRRTLSRMLPQNRTGRTAGAWTLLSDTGPWCNPEARLACNEKAGFESSRVHSVAADIACVWPSCGGAAAVAAGLASLIPAAFFHAPASSNSEDAILTSLRSPCNSGCWHRRHGVTRSSIEVRRVSDVGPTPAGGTLPWCSGTHASSSARRPRFESGRQHCAALVQRQHAAPPRPRSPFESGMPHGRTVGRGYFRTGRGRVLPPVNVPCRPSSPSDARSRSDRDGQGRASSLPFTDHQRGSRSTAGRFLAREEIAVRFRAPAWA